MSTAPMEELRFPIGKFTYEGPYDSSRRERFIADLERAPALLREAVRGLNEEQLNTPYRPGGWTVRQVVHHLPDSHLNAYIRFKWTLTEDEPVIKTYNETLWAETPEVAVTPVEVSLAMLENLHRRFVALLRAMRPEDFQRTMQHPELGRVALDRYVGLYAWHGRHHVAHITSLRQRMGW
jgi:hypothetical protein